MSARVHAAAVVLVLAAVLAMTSCLPLLVVRLRTVVFHDGSLERTLEVAGRPFDPEEVPGPGWLANEVGVSLASPAAWEHVEIADTRFSASGFFRSAAELPPGLRLRTDAGERPDRLETEVAIDERLILRRYRFRERHGDPFGSDALDRALDAIVDLAATALTNELRLQLGDDVDTASAQSWLRGEARALARSVLQAGRHVGPNDDPAARQKAWTDTLSQLGVPVPATPDASWSDRVPALAAWARGRLAEVLAVPQSELAFVPVEDRDALEVWGHEVVERTWGDFDALWEQLEPQLAALAGYYGSDAAPRFRFEAMLELPGTLLHTNGTPAGQGVAWLFRAEDLAGSDVWLHATSIEVVDEPLIALAARRRFDPERLLRLEDLLWTRDRDGVLLDALGRAVAEGKLELLRRPGTVPDELAHLAIELADLLDPDRS